MFGLALLLLALIDPVDLHAGEELEQGKVGLVTGPRLGK
jgi:hypothetical protein